MGFLPRMLVRRTNSGVYFASSFAVVKPIPWLAPVTMHTLPSILLDIDYIVKFKRNSTKNNHVLRIKINLTPIFHR